MINRTGFKQPYDVALLTYSVLKRLGCGDVDSFGQRLRSQKVQYFAQLFRVSPPYPFNLYLRGPYSPDLAHDLFLIKNKKIKVSTIRFIPKELEERFNELKGFIDKHSTIRDLEVIATLHWLIRVAKLSESVSLGKLKELKRPPDKELDYAAKIVKTLP